MNSPHLGERLTQLRQVLMEEHLSPAPWSRANVARVAGVSPAALARLEKTGAGTAANLAAVLTYYQEEGFNLAWVLTPDNSAIPLRAYRDIFQNGQLAQAQEPLARLHQLLPPAIAALEAGPLPTADAQRTLLTQVHHGILHALLHVLPSRRLIMSKTDLRAYQRCLPPVLAQSTGWRSASLCSVPYHFYVAEESLPWCGDRNSYLTYDPGLAAVSDSLKCESCLRQVGADAGDLPRDASATAQR